MTELRSLVLGVTAVAMASACSVDADIAKASGGSSETTSGGGGTSSMGSGGAGPAGTGGSPSSSTGVQTCDAASCPDGCCTFDGACVTGTANSACGTAGATCVDCTQARSEHCPCACDPETKSCAIACACGDGLCNQDVVCQENASTCPGDCAPLDCTSAADAISAKTGGVGKTCSTVVRLDYQTKDLLGYAVVCGGYSGVPSEAAARATAQADTGFGQSGSLISGAMPQDEYVFYQAAGDFGSVAAVNTRNGLSVFGGSIVWAGSGNITYPPWSSALELGDGCGTICPVVQARGFDLRSGQPLGDADVTDAFGRVCSTALVDGIGAAGYLFDVMVFLYPRSVGLFDPTTAEWIVIVNSGWLE